MIRTPYHGHIIQQPFLHIYSSKFSANWQATATYVRMHGFWIMWLCYWVHITVCMAYAFLVYVLCQPVHSCMQLAIPTSTRFLFYKDISTIYYACCPRTYSSCVIHTHVHRWMTFNQYTCPPWSFLPKVQVTQSKAQMNHHQRLS